MGRVGLSGRIVERLEFFIVRMAVHPGWLVELKRPFGWIRIPAARSDRVSMC
jgi:hypothetical protein